MKAAHIALSFSALACLAVAVPIPLASANGTPRQAKTSQEAAPAQLGNDLAKTAEFDVASIRQNKPSGNRPTIVRIRSRDDDGRLYATAVTAKMLMQVAYDVLDMQMEGGPGWVDSERFDIQAEADDALSDQLKRLTPQEARPVKQHMLQVLLADRFKLTVHQETKEAPIYELVVAKNGPKIQDVSKTGRISPDSPFPHPEGVGASRAFNTTMSSFAESLSHLVGRMVVDKTGLAGRYYFSYQYSRESTSVFWRARAGGVPEPAGGAAAVANGLSGVEPDSPGPSIFTALREQLGLELKPAKGPVPVLVIDHIEQPSEN